MSVLSRNANRVLFIENTGVRAATLRDIPRLWNRFLNWRKGFKGIRRENENLYIYSPLALPFPYSRIAIKINKIMMLSVIKRWMDSMEFHNPIVWSFLPTGIVLNILDDLNPSIFIYYCIDDFASSSSGARKIKGLEEGVIKKADIVFATSHKLYERCLSVNKVTHIFPFGISIDGYNKARESHVEMPDEMRGLRRPIIGYVGGLHKWIDTNLLRQIAMKRNDVSIVLVGPRQADLSLVDKLENVFIFGKKERDTLPNYVKFFDVGIIPYRLTAYTENVYPTKINEYLAMGKPVLSTRIPEVVEFDKQNGGGFIHFISSEADIDKFINSLSSQEDGISKDRRVAVANKNSWTSKIESMCGIIEAKLEERKNEIDAGWLKRFKKIYLKTRKKVLGLAAAASIVYISLFYTPIVWFLASPLEVQDEPKKVDAIVVFGGGVGEGGRPGPSTSERAFYSVELYKRGYADNIIFSSGYTYKYNDAENMMLFAQSLGVPKGQILLEKKAGNAYENVKFVTDILRQKKWDEVILITSPYNTRRSKLLFDKFAGHEMKIIYCPVKNPQFYYRYSALRIDQLQAIAHEYLAIIYYKYKGYI
ncbi:MAG: hypothetical protein A2987_06595 [Omnitrophica bacterium RIFCSPLOWO2_01_FULL_45_10]|nr:MAG: hypothetical protein A2987_06595 [Omnitrophica bacterium RIFCSPLOWO2_01_FULL_45_10]